MANGGSRSHRFLSEQNTKDGNPAAAIGVNKTLLASVLFIAAVAGAVAAWLAKSRGGACVALAEGFAGGALLNAALVHLLADAQSDLSEAGYPLAELLCGCGCVLTHLVEAFAEASLQRVLAANARKEDLATPEPSNLGCPAEGLPGGREPVPDTDLVFVEQNLVAAGAHFMVDVGSVAALARTWRSIAAGPLLMVALSVHSLLEGLSLGAAGTARAIHIFLAILAHKGVAAFSLGTAWLTASSSSTCYAIAMAWFASVTPIGVLVGTSVEGGKVAAYITALSAGTFLYVGLIEACPGVKSPWLPGRGAIHQVAAFATGFACMAILALWT